MSLWFLAAAASAAPVLTAPEQSPLERCVAAAQAEIDVALPPAPDLTPGQDLERIAIVVGVPCHERPEIPSLAYSSRDAARMGAHLAEQGFHVVPLTHVVDRARFLDTLDRAEAALAPEGELVVYFSGHGVLATEHGQVRRFLVFSDTDLSRVTRTGLRGIVLDDRISRLRASSRVLIQDTCFAATAGGKSLGMSAGTAGTLKGVAVPEAALELQPGDVRLYAAQYFEQAIESPEHRSSLYTHHLLTALQEPAADLDGDGCVDLREGHHWARDRTVSDRQGHQSPQSLFVSQAIPRLGCAGSSKPTRGVVMVPDDKEWTVEVRDRAGTLKLREAGTVPAGSYRIQVGELRLRDARTWSRRKLLDTRLRIRAGEWLDLDALVAVRRVRLTELTAEVSTRQGPTLPAAGGGLTLLHTLATSPVGRPTVGVRMQYMAGLRDSSFRGTTPSSPVLGKSFEVHALAGTSFTIGRERPWLAVGPLVGLGVASVTQCSAPPCSGGITRLGTVAQAGIRARWLVSEALAFGLELGADGHLLETSTANGASVIEPVVSPTLRLGLGPRL